MLSRVVRPQMPERHLAAPAAARPSARSLDCAMKIGLVLMVSLSTHNSSKVALMTLDLYYFQPLVTNSARVYLTLLEKGVPFNEHVLGPGTMSHLGD